MREGFVVKGRVEIGGRYGDVLGAHAFVFGNPFLEGTGEGSDFC